jgi:hypothetical protein
MRAPRGNPLDNGRTVIHQYLSCVEEWSVRSDCIFNTQVRRRQPQRHPYYPRLTLTRRSEDFYTPPEGAPEELWRCARQGGDIASHLSEVITDFWGFVLVRRLRGW